MLSVAETRDGAVPSEAKADERAVAGLPEVGLWRVALRLVYIQWIALGFCALWLADRLGLVWLSYAVTGKRARYERIDAAVALRLAFERLGPTYVKLGQLVASGEALFPAHYSREFQKCLDRVPPFPFEAVEQTLREEIGEDALSRFAKIEREPMAAASIAQVHAAISLEGDEFVIKVQRPRLPEVLATDLVLLRFISRLAARVSLHARRANAPAIVDDFAINLVAELDFRNEAARIGEFLDVMKQMGTRSVVAPHVHEALSGPRVLTMERFRGWSLGDTEALLASSYDAEERLLTGIRAWFQCLIARGFFHGDVHGGNFMLLEDGRIGFLDFGIVGRFEDDQKKNVLDYVLAFQSRDFARLADALVAMGTIEGEVDRDAFAADLERAFAPMIDPEEGFQMKEILPALIRVARAHQMSMPRDLVLVTKQLVYLDRYSRALGGPKMNVLTDQRLMNMIMQDMLVAMST